MTDDARELIDRCRALPRGRERTRLEEQLGRLLKREDALIAKRLQEPTWFLDDPLADGDGDNA
jgi:hypothetical protein